MGNEMVHLVCVFDMFAAMFDTICYVSFHVCVLCVCHALCRVWCVCMVCVYGVCVWCVCSGGAYLSGPYDVNHG